VNALPNGQERNEVANPEPIDRPAVDLAHQRITAILAPLEEGLQLWDGAGHLIYANPATHRQFCALEALGSGRHWTELACDCRTESGEPCPVDDFPVAHALRGGHKATPLLLRVNRADGAARWLRLAAHPLNAPDGSTSGVESRAKRRTAGAIEALLALSPKTANVERDGQLQEVAIGKLLPGDVVVLRHGERLAVCLLDLDGFKAVNDGFGHPAGDETLKEISQRLLTQVRAGDVLARLGGDEFGIVMRAGSTEAAQALARRIVRAVSQPIRLSTGDEVGVGVSVGMAAYANDVMSVRKLVTQADQALYEAKKQNERRWKMFVGLRA